MVRKSECPFLMDGAEVRVSFLIRALVITHVFAMHFLFSEAFSFSRAVNQDLSFLTCSVTQCSVFYSNNQSFTCPVLVAFFVSNSAGLELLYDVVTIGSTQTGSRV